MDIPGKINRKSKSVYNNRPTNTPPESFMMKRSATCKTVKFGSYDSADELMERPPAPSEWREGPRFKSDEKFVHRDDTMILEVPDKAHGNTFNSLRRRQTSDTSDNRPIDGFHNWANNDPIIPRRSGSMHPRSKSSRHYGSIDGFHDWINNVPIVTESEESSRGDTMPLNRTSMSTFGNHERNDSQKSQLNTRNVLSSFEEGADDSTSSKPIHLKSFKGVPSIGPQPLSNDMDDSIRRQAINVKSFKKKGPSVKPKPQRASTKTKQW